MDNNKEMVDFLIKNKAEVNVSLNDEGATLLTNAIRLESYPIVEILLKNGANTTANQKTIQL